MSRLYATATSEKASKGQGGQDYLIIDLNVGKEQVAQIELLYNNDSKRHGTDLDEWVLQYRPEGSDEDLEWTILAQGNVIPESKKCYTEHTRGRYGGVSVPHAHNKTKGKRQKGEYED